MKFHKITIIGVGLIGGSIGLAAKRKKLAHQIIGVCRHKASLRKALRIGAIDKGSLDYKTAVKDADLIILAAPVSQIIKIGQEIIPYLKPGSLITDVGSTKAEVVREIEKKLPERIYFVGAHPLAGSEKRGADQARADLFQGAICILTKGSKTKIAALNKMAGFWQSLGCRIKVLTPQRHDRIVALISHLPHLAAAQLVKTARGNLDFAASGFFDTTRIASSDGEIWSDIFVSNKRFITQAVDGYIQNLKLVRGLIRKGDRKTLAAEFRKIKALRDARQK